LFAQAGAEGAPRLDIFRPRVGLPRHQTFRSGQINNAFNSLTSAKRGEERPSTPLQAPVAAPRAPRQRPLSAPRAPAHLPASAATAPIARPGMSGAATA